MKTTRNSLVASGLSLVLSVGILMSATFAWFTDSVTNSGNTITSGTLDIQLNGGSTAALFSGGENFLWEPGRSQKATVTISNKGSLWLKYMLHFTNVVTSDTIEPTSDITEVLDVYRIEGNSVDNLDGETPLGTMKELMGKDNIGEELSLAPKGSDANADETFTLVVKMQDNAGNEYQGASVSFNVEVLATQYAEEKDGFGNRFYDQGAEYPTVPVEGTTQALIDALEAAEPGDVLQLSAAEYQLTEPLEIPSGVTIRGANAGIPAIEWIDDATEPGGEKATKIVAAPGENRVIKIEQNSGETVSDVVLDGILVDGNDEDTKGIFVKKHDGNPMTGIVIRNCAVINCGNDGIDVNNTSGAIIEGNYVSGVYDNGIQLNGYDNEAGITSYIRNNVISNVGGETGGTINGAIAVSGGTGDVVVSGNTVEKVRSKHQVAHPLVDMGESSIVVESVTEGGLITIENNDLSDVEQGIAVYKFSAPTANDKVVIQNNTITGAKTFSIATSTLNYNTPDFATATVEITGNTFHNTSDPSKGYIYVEKTNRYGESTTGWEVIATENTSDNQTTAG